MSKPVPLHFGLPSRVAHIRVERGKNCWRLWLTANGDFTLGTFIELKDSGEINRVTWHPDGSETVLEITNDEDH